MFKSFNILWLLFFFFLSCFNHFKLKSVTVKICPGPYTIPLFSRYIATDAMWGNKNPHSKMIAEEWQLDNFMDIDAPPFFFPLDEHQRWSGDATHDKPNHNANCLNYLLWKKTFVKMSQNVHTTRRSKYVAAIFYLSFNRYESVSLHPVVLHYLQPGLYYKFPAVVHPGFFGHLLIRIIFRELNGSRSAV